MPWAPPSWCTEPKDDALNAVVTLTSHCGQPRRNDISGQPFFLLKREFKNDDSEGCASSWHAAVLRDERGVFYIMDLNTSTGTYMKEKQLESLKAEPWNPGDVVVLGKPLNHDKVVLEVKPRVSGSTVPVKRSGPEQVAEPPEKRRKENCPVTITIPEKEQTTRQVSGPTKCDKCDGAHLTDSCPHFRKKREQHKDAWVNYNKNGPKQMGRSGSKLVVKNARTVPQPGDGSCLFHSLCYGLNGGQRNGQFNAGALRRELSMYISEHPRTKIAGDFIEEWVQWDARTNVRSYARRMASGGWGGGIEMAVCSLIKKVNVHVYERRRCGTFERISCFDSPVRTTKTIHVLYQGGVHYDALIPNL